MELQDTESVEWPAIDKGIISRSLGAVLGACYGDAAGAYLEGRRDIPSKLEVLKGLNLYGGGVHGVAPGQVTDDGEMTISLARGLANCEGKFDIEKIAKEYAAWVRSMPFDMGITIGSTIGCVLKGEKNPPFKKQLDTLGYATAMKVAARTLELALSQSNGSMMRCTPLAVFGYKLSDDELATIVKEDSGLSHSNKNVIDSTTAYCIAIAELINNGDAKAAHKRAKEWLNKSGNKDVITWMEESEDQLKVIPFQPQVGWVKIAFVYAFRHLLYGSPFLDAIKATLAGGGDTDTNACIVGGMMGARWGIDLEEAKDNELSKFIKQVISCNTSLGRKRPDSLHPKHLPKLISIILATSPSNL